MITLIIVIALSMGCNYFYQKHINNKLNQVQKEQKEMATGVETLFVDDCSGVFPGPDNYLPPRLTTPIAYVKTLYHDPFSPANEPYRYIDQPGRGNGAMYIIASRGPDGDWDVTRVPKGVKRFFTATVPFDSRFIKYANESTESKPEDNTNYSKVEYYVTADGKKVYPVPGKKPTTEQLRSYVSMKYKEAKGELLVTHEYHFSNLEYYISSDGQRHDTPYLIFRDLPLPGKNSGWLTPKELQEFLATYQIAIYDPTNGIASDGDILFSNAR